MAVLQETIHKLEVAGGIRHLRKALLALLLLVLVAGYNWRGFRNMNTQEAMDSAQLARNIASGKGYTTSFIRPLSMYLLASHSAGASQPRQGLFGSAGFTGEQTRIEGPHPDLANPPVYPLVLAGLMKVVPFDYTVYTNKTFWSYGNRFWRYQPDFIISIFNQMLFLAAVGLVFLLGRRLFGAPVAWLAALVMLGTELFWRFSVSGLSTMVLLVVFLGLTWCLVLLEAETREPRGGAGRLFLLAALVGVLLGVGGLTRYAFGWLALPVLLFVLLYAGHRRVLLAVVAFAAFALVMAPWLGRNYSLSGHLFGTSGFAMYENTDAYPKAGLEHTLSPNLDQPAMGAVRTKLSSNLRQIVQSDLPRLGGSWLTAFFLVGLLVVFGDPAVTRLRYFLLGALVVLAITQALARTQLSEDSPDINSENLLVLLAPLVLIYGSSLFYLLLDQVDFQYRELRLASVVGFGLIMCLPMLLSFLPPRTVPVAYPPYHPLILQKAANWVKPDELIASDMPWAMAWYGQRRSIWLESPADLGTVNDEQRRIDALLLTSLTIDKADARSLTYAQTGSDQFWHSLILQALPYALQARPTSARGSSLEVRLQMRRSGGSTPVGFPLRYWQAGWPDWFLLTSRDQPPVEVP